MTRIVWRIRPTGLPRKRTAPFWRGETAQQIIKRRLKEYRAKAARRKTRRK